MGGEEHELQCRFALITAAFELLELHKFMLNSIILEENDQKSNLCFSGITLYTLLIK